MERETPPGNTTMAVKLHRAGYAHAQKLVGDGKVVLDDRDAWGEHQPSAGEENVFIDKRHEMVGQTGWSEWLAADPLTVDVVRPGARNRIEWDDGRESVYTPAAGALHLAHETGKRAE
jgi:hypothetical protein